MNTLEEFKGLDKSAVQDRAARTVCSFIYIIFLFGKRYTRDMKLTLL